MEHKYLHGWLLCTHRHFSVLYRQKYKHWSVRKQNTTATLRIVLVWGQRNHIHSNKHSRARCESHSTDSPQNKEKYTFFNLLFFRRGSNEVDVASKPVRLMLSHMWTIHFLYYLLSLWLRVATVDLNKHRLCERRHPGCRHVTTTGWCISWGRVAQSGLKRFDEMARQVFWWKHSHPWKDTEWWELKCNSSIVTILFKIFGNCLLHATYR